MLGPNAAEARTLGGGSATVFPSYVVSPLDGLRAALGDRVTVTHATGGRVADRVPPPPLGWLTLPDGSAPGTQVRFLDADGVTLGEQQPRGGVLLLAGARSAPA